ncbi:MAG TPA: hypothetical protein VLD85_00895, partial [Anaeromyxobacteraceae bacterium]|nr:hypothetical protein [Anaeromyxobacteraceae bacterium]
QAAGRLPEARDILLELLSRLGPEASTRLLAAAHLSLRLTSLAALSRVAARLEDRELARRSIQEGLGLWAAARIARPRVRDLAAFAEWEEWARRYLAALP